MAETFETLEKEYCPPLDPALFSAIVLDYNLTDASELVAARQTLDALKESALEQDSSAFDPSGNSTHFADAEDNGRSEVDGSSSEVCGTKSEDTDSTSLSSGMHALSLNGLSEASRDNGFIDEAQNLDFSTQVELLKEMFPNALESSIPHTLKKCNGNYNRALEELLNHAFFNDGAAGLGDDRVVATGIDAFSEEYNVRRGRKRKDKKNRMTLSGLDDRRSSSLPVEPKTSAWEKSKRDVEFISTRMNLPIQTVSSIYHQNGTLLPATIVAIIESSAASAKTIGPDAIIKANAFELGKDFPSIAPAHLAGLIRLTHPSTASAHELAKALTTSTHHANGGIQVIPLYAPIDVSSDGDDADSRSSTKSKSRSEGFSSSSTHIDPAYNQALAHSHNQSAQQSFAQASAAYRRGKSDHLMGAAAGYYSQLGRDFASRRAEASSSAADGLVDSQSSATQLDLHGVSVKDAVRIARQKTELWWRNSNGRVMGLDGRVRNDNGNGSYLSIVTGMGRHSTGGIGKLGPAVGRMLVQEGWHVVFGEGVLTVTGRKR